MAGQAPDTTATAEFESPGRRPRRSFLFVVLRADHPLAPSARLSLDGVKSLSLGRSADAAFSTFEEEGSFSLLLPDRRISASHARLTCAAGRWSLEDAGSKNGTILNGTRIQSAALHDGDVIELGHTFLVLREQLPVPGKVGALLDSADIVPPAPGLATLLPPLADEFARLGVVAPSKVPVIIGGESGAGKEVVAAAIHRMSRRPGAFQAVNCGAIPAALVESELFGHRKGAFSGADEDRPGLIRSADRGTLFLDEIGDLPLPAQATLLRALQESEVVPVGGTRATKVDFRLIAATHRSLDELAGKERFRRDLLARLSGFSVTLPALRERLEDLGLFVAALLRRHFPDRADSITFSPEAARALLSHSWPLNVRELEKCLHAAAVLAGTGWIELSHLPAAVQTALEAPAPSPKHEPEPLSAEGQALRDRLVALLEQHAGNVTRVAEAMGKARNQIHRWMDRYSIDPERYRKT